MKQLNAIDYWWKKLRNSPPNRITDQIAAFAHETDGHYYDEKYFPTLFYIQYSKDHPELPLAYPVLFRIEYLPKLYGYRLTVEQNGKQLFEASGLSKENSLPQHLWEAWAAAKSSVMAELQVQIKMVSNPARRWM